MRSLYFVSALVLALVGCADSTEEGDQDPNGNGNRNGQSGQGNRTTETNCTVAAESLLKPVDAVTRSTVRVLADDGNVMTLLVDATGGGTSGGASGPPTDTKAPRVYVNLETGTRVDVTDKSAKSSIEWDLSFKRAVLFTNGGDGGSGEGGARLIEKDFGAVTRADAERASLLTEQFFNDRCEARVDAAGSVKTSFDGWYDYNQQSHQLTPRRGTWIVRGAAGKLFKLRIRTYEANQDGSPGGIPGRYVIETVTL